MNGDCIGRIHDLHVLEVSFLTKILTESALYLFQWALNETSFKANINEIVGTCNQAMQTKIDNA